MSVVTSRRPARRATIGRRRVVVAGAAAFTGALWGRRRLRALNLGSAPSAIDTVFDSTLGHNISNLRIHTDGSIRVARFLDFYVRSGGLERWGHPISEALVENEVLCQYFQRGVLEWAPVANGFALTRRLAWDYLGGGLDGSPDLGVEAGVSNPHDGRFEGPFGHKVSNADVIGTPTAFLDFFDRLGGVASFGFPKSEARLDTGAAGTLFAPGASPGFVRQYFQAAVMEWHPGAPDPVRLRLLGDDLRNRAYPSGHWTMIRSFAASPPLTAGDQVNLEVVERRSGPIATGDPAASAGFEIAPFAETVDLGLPAALGFHPDGRLFVCLSNSAVVTMRDTTGDGHADDIVTFAAGDGLADPRGVAFADDGVLVSVAGKIVRLRDRSGNGQADESVDVVTGLEFNPALPFHRNNGIAIGPDGLLYITAGSTSNRDEVPEGRWTAAILRARLDGTGLEKFATGLRNPYDLAFAPNGELFCTDNGPDTSRRTIDDAPDELNHVVQGADYGHPGVWGTPPDGDATRGPVVEISAHAAAVGLTFYAGPQAREFEGDALIATWGPGGGRSSFAHNPRATHGRRRDVHRRGHAVRDRPHPAHRRGRGTAR